MEQRLDHREPQQQWQPLCVPSSGHRGGHGKARPRSGDHAIEIYSSDRVTRLSQQVTLEPGRYRLSAWARNNGASINPELALIVGDQTITVPVLSDRYRQIFADFEVKQAGPQLVGFISKTLGLALDDTSLVRLQGDEPPPPYLFFDLSPTSEERCAGVQTVLRGQKQWVNFTISTIAPKLVKTPVLRITGPTDVMVSGFNEKLLNAWRRGDTQALAVNVPKVTPKDGKLRDVWELPVPRFVNGESSPVSFGGFWVLVTDGRDKSADGRAARRAQTVCDRDSETGVARPAATATDAATHEDRLLRRTGLEGGRGRAAGGLAPAVRHDGRQRVERLSHHQDDAPPTPLEDELVRERAAREFGVKEFWPNYSSLLETGEGISAWQSIADQYHDPDMFMVSANGTINRRTYNLRYAADKGEAWTKSALRAYQRTLERPQMVGLSYRNTGFITDALEGVPMSYDATTLADFAKQAGLDPATVTVAAVQGPLSKQWLTYNMTLYDRVAANLAAALRQVNPQVAVVNTAGAYGPGGVGSLPLPEQAAWAKTYDYTMPQWYSMGFYGDYYISLLEEGLKAGIYGGRDKSRLYGQSGYADVIPLWNLSMGAGIEDPANLRFKVFDLISASAVVKGGLLHRQQRLRRRADDDRVIRTAHAAGEGGGVLRDGREGGPGGDLRGRAGGSEADRGDGPGGQADDAGAAGQDTVVRVHRLNTGGRVALLTVISHANQGVGERARSSSI